MLTAIPAPKISFETFVMNIRRNPPRLAMQWRKPALHYAQESVMEFAAM